MVYIGVLEARGRELDSETPGQKKNPTNKVHAMPRYCRYDHFTSEVVCVETIIQKQNVYIKIKLGKYRTLKYGEKERYGLGV